MTCSSARLLEHPEISALGLIFAFRAIHPGLDVQRKFKTCRSWAQTIVYLPHFISVVIVAGIVIRFLSPSIGIVNLLLKGLGSSRYFLTSAGMVSSDLYRLVGLEERASDPSSISPPSLA